MTVDSSSPARARSYAERKEAEEQSLRKVQQRVAAVGFFAVAIHGVAGTIAGAYVIVNDGRHGAAMALLAMSAIIAVLTVGGVRLILQKSLWSPLWLGLALAPTVAAFIWLG